MDITSELLVKSNAKKELIFWCHVDKKLVALHCKSADFNNRKTVIICEMHDESEKICTSPVHCK